MSQPCSTCGYQNPADSVFCMRCGSKVEATRAYQQFSSHASPKPSGDASNTGNFGNAGYSSSASPGYQEQIQGAQAQSMTAFFSEPLQMGNTSGSTSGRIPRRAFAGLGTRITHYAWLLSYEHLNAGKLRSTILDLLRQRSFQPLKLDTKKLQEHGYWDEERDYITMQRGVTTIFVYVAPAGQDLYISRTTTVQLSFDPMRIVFLACVVGAVFFYPSIVQGLTANIFSFTIIGCVSGLLYISSIIILVSFLIASIKHWLVDKDLYIYLRKNHLHDFEVDDVELLERATDETIHAAVKQLSLDATKIVPPPQGYQTKRRVRAI